MCGGKCGLDGDDMPVAGRCLVEPAERLKYIAEINMSVDKIGLERTGAVIMHRRLGEAGKPGQCKTGVVVRLRIFHAE